MKKLSLLALTALTLPAFADIAPPPGPRPMPRPPHVINVPETQLYLANVKGTTVRPGATAGTLSVGYTVTYSNHCVAGANTVAPLTLRKYDHGRNSLEVLVQARSRGLRIACPAVYQPVDVRYETQVAQLSSGALYDVSFQGNNSGSRVVQVRVP